MGSVQRGGQEPVKATDGASASLRPTSGRIERVLGLNLWMGQRRG